MTERRVIVIAGVPGVGKSTVAMASAERLKCSVIGVTELALKEGTLLGRDDERETEVVDLPRLMLKVTEAVNATVGPIIVEGHFAYDVVPIDLVSHAIVLRRAPWVLKEELRDRGYSSEKTHENVEAELLDVPLIEAIESLGPDFVCEVDTTGKTSEETMGEVLGIINGSVPCRRRLVDWLGSPEARGLLGGG
jgi:broad-specificity NMP kinase